MADPFQRLITELSRLTQGLRGEASDEWGSLTEGSRPVIRQSIQNAFQDWQDGDLLAINDLTLPPRPFNRSLSISHTHDFGGWMSAPRPAQIGWDVELKSRIKLPIIERVCSREEIEKAPKPQFLWAAKEAFFKSLEDDQPSVIINVNIAEWQPRAPDMWAWRGYGARNGEGLLIESGPWLFAACLIP